MQESSDSCDSETTVTSHPSQDVVTPLAVDQPAFDLPDGTKEEVGPGGAAEADGRSSLKEDHSDDGSVEQVPQYTAHQIPRNRPMEMQRYVTQDEEQVETCDQTNPEPEPEITQSMSTAEQEQKAELEHTQNHTASQQESQHTQKPIETTAATEPPTEGVDAEDKAQDELEFLEDSGSSSPVPSSPVLSALKRATKNQLSRAGQCVDPQSVYTPQVPGRGRGRGRGGIPLQRSSSLPSSFLSPSRVVSSVRIQFGRGHASCTQPRYSFKYTQEDGGDKEEEEEDVEDVEDRQTNCLSTLIINPASSSDLNDRSRLPTEAPIPPKAIPRYLMRSSYSLQSSSPPPDWSPEGHAHSWSTQSIPNLFSQQQMGQFQQNMGANQNQQSWNPGQMFSYPNPSPNPSTQYLNPSPCPSPNRNPSPYPFTLNPPPQYPSPLQPYASLPNLLHHNPSLIHHSSLNSLYQPTAPTIPHHSSLSNLYQPSASAAPHHTSLGSLHPGTPATHHHGHNHLYSHQSPYHATPQGSQFASPYLGFHGYNLNPHPAFPQHVTQGPPLAPEHSFHSGLTPPQGFIPGLAPAYGQNHTLHPGFTPSAPSSTEMQLRKVLHEIRGMVQSLSQVGTL